jgi:uncharacterized membrane protein YfcA
VFTLGLVLSLAIGLSLGLLGGGGSMLTVPVLHYVFGEAAHDAVSGSLLVVGTTSLVALIPHARAGNVHWRIGLAFGATSMAAAFAGGRLNAVLPGVVLIVAFACVMIVAGIAMLRRARGRLAPCPAAEIRLSRVLAIGLGVGSLTGTLGAGGGFLIVPALALVGGLAIRQAVATSLLVISLNSFAGFAATAEHASVDWTVAAAVTAVAIGGSFVGARLGKRLSAQHLQRAFGWFVIVVGVLMAMKELS